MQVRNFILCTAIIYIMGEQGVTYFAFLVPAKDQEDFVLCIYLEAIRVNYAATTALTAGLGDLKGCSQSSLLVMLL